MHYAEYIRLRVLADSFEPIRENTNTLAYTGIPKIYRLTVSVMQICPLFFGSTFTPKLAPKGINC